MGKAIWTRITDHSERVDTKWKNECRTICHYRCNSFMIIFNIVCSSIIDSTDKSQRSLMSSRCWRETLFVTYPYRTNSVEFKFRWNFRSETLGVTCDDKRSWGRRDAEAPNWKFAWTRASKRDRSESMYKTWQKLQKQSWFQILLDKSDSAIHWMQCRHVDTTRTWGSCVEYMYHAYTAWGKWRPRMYHMGKRRHVPHGEIMHVPHGQQWQQCNLLELWWEPNREWAERCKSLR